jgi:hypothetical protein
VLQQALQPHSSTTRGHCQDWHRIHVDGMVDNTVHTPWVMSNIVLLCCFGQRPQHKKSTGSNIVTYHGAAGTAAMPL